MVPQTKIPVGRKTAGFFVRGDNAQTVTTTRRDNCSAAFKAAGEIFLRKINSHVEAEISDVAVPHDVIFAFEANKTFVAGGGD